MARNDCCLGLMIRNVILRRKLRLRLMIRRIGSAVNRLLGSNVSMCMNSRLLLRMVNIRSRLVRIRCFLRCVIRISRLCRLLRFCLMSWSTALVRGLNLCRIFLLLRLRFVCRIRLVFLCVRILTRRRRILHVRVGLLLCTIWTGCVFRYFAGLVMMMRLRRLICLNVIRIRLL